MATADEIKMFDMVADHERRLKALEATAKQVAEAVDDKPKQK